MQNKVKGICSLEWILSTCCNQNTFKNKLSLIDLYSGCGGMTLGVKEALKSFNFDVNIKLALDIDKEALNVFRTNLCVGDDIALNSDITEFVSNHIGEPLNEREKSIKKVYKNVDILVAGPPCQGHSNLNNHTRRDDPRNELYLNAIRFVEILKPKLAIIENVSTVIHDKENVVYKSNLILQKVGYHIKSLIIDASKYGLAQSRKRHFQIAVLNSDLDIDLADFAADKTFTVADYIKDLIHEHRNKKGIFFTPSKTKEANKKRIEFLYKNNLYDLPNHKRPNCHKSKNHSYKSCYGRIHWNKPAQTITSGFGSMGQGRNVHPLEKRVITPHEAARLQGFPDFFDFKNVKLRTDLHTMIANAVPPKMIAIIVCYFFNKNLFQHV